MAINQITQQVFLFKQSGKWSNFCGRYPCFTWYNDKKHDVANWFVLLDDSGITDYV